MCSFELTFFYLKLTVVTKPQCLQSNHCKWCYEITVTVRLDLGISPRIQASPCMSWVGSEYATSESWWKILDESEHFFFSLTLSLGKQHCMVCVYEVRILGASHFEADVITLGSWLWKFCLMPRPHPAHARRRGLVSKLQIRGLAPEAWNDQWNCRAPFIASKNKY